MRFFACATIALSMARAVAQEQPAPENNQPQLVTVDWLKQHLNDSDLRIIDARGALTAYMQGHIPEAVYLNPETLRVSLRGVPGTLLPPDYLKDIFGAIGVGNDAQVVIYSSAEEAFAGSTYVWMVLEYLGHAKSAVLDGGFEKWQASKLPVSKDIPQIAATEFTPHPNPQLLVKADQVQQASNSGKTIVIDARSPEQYAAGHIPGAKNLPVRDMVGGKDNPGWKNADELRKQAAAQGVTKDTPVITYCNSGREASDAAFTLRNVLGFQNVKVYDGSMLDWRSRKLPTQTADASTTQAK